MNKTCHNCNCTEDKFKLYYLIPEAGIYRICPICKEYNAVWCSSDCYGKCSEKTLKKENICHYCNENDLRLYYTPIASKALYACPTCEQKEVKWCSVECHGLCSKKKLKKDFSCHNCDTKECPLRIFTCSKCHKEVGICTKCNILERRTWHCTKQKEKLLNNIKYITREDGLGSCTHLKTIYDTDQWNIIKKPTDLGKNVLWIIICDDCYAIYNDLKE